MLLKKHRSSSLIEVIVSLILFSVIFSIVIGIIVNLSGKKHAHTIEARLILNKELIKCKNEHRFINETYSIQNYIIDKQTVSFNENTLRISLSAQRNDKIIDEINELVQTR